jgi:MFS family permease
MAATVLFVFADSPLWLFLARFLQGVATGAAVSSASAAMLDLHPRRDAAGVSFANGVASSVGIGLGVLASSALVQLGEAPRVLPYVVLLALLGIAVAGVYWMPESVSTRRRLRLTVERPSVPSSVRRPFLLAGLAVLSSWSIGGLFFSLGPELGSHVFHSANVIVSGIGVVALSGAAALAQVVFRRVAPWLATALGSAALGVGMSLIVLATHTDSSSLYLTSCIVGGVGFGVAFVGGLSALVIAIPSEHRAAVMSAFYLVAYGSLSIPAVVAGAIVDHVGLQRTFESFGETVSAIALIVTVAAWQTRPEHGLA